MISVEFLLLFAVLLAAVLILSSQMLSYGAAVRERISEVALTASAESSARAAESAYRSGISLEMPEEVRIGETLLADSGRNIIEAEGVFEYDEAEPV